MSDFKFNEQQNFSTRSIKEQRPFFVRLVMKIGLVKNEKQAHWVLLGVVGVCLVLMFIFLPSVFGEGNVPDRYKYDPDTAELDIEDLR